MKPTPQSPEPQDSATRKAVAPVICYPTEGLNQADLGFRKELRENLTLVHSLTIEPRDAKCFEVPAGSFCRILCPDGPQVGDLNLWHADNLNEKFFSGKTRALHGTHVGVGDRLWSSLPYLRPIATVTYDTLDWYGFDEFGGGVHDVIGTRCDPYTNTLLNDNEYHYCCHSNLTRALVNERGLVKEDAELLVHDVLNVFMCTGFTRDTHQYFMKASPVRQGDYLEFFAEIDLLGALSTCPGGDCSTVHSSEVAACFPLEVQILKPQQSPPDSWHSARISSYSRNHGLKAGP